MNQFNENSKQFFQRFESKIIFERDPVKDLGNFTKVFSSPIRLWVSFLPKNLSKPCMQRMITSTIEKLKLDLIHEIKFSQFSDQF